MSKCPLLIATPNHWVVDCYGEECAWFHSICKQPMEAPKTNADRIRSMTDEGLAEFFENPEINKPWHRCKECKWESCIDCMLEWLKQEAE